MRCVYEIQRMDAQGSAFNSNKDAAFVICANLNHWIVLSNINFNILKFQKENPDTAFQTDDDFNRTEWYFYDTLNNDYHSSFCSKVLEKVFPDQTGCNLSRIEVQQQTGTEDCGLFACAFLELLSHCKDPASYTFNQVNLRNKFTKYENCKIFKGFGGVYNNTAPILHPLAIDWTYTWDESCQAIRDHIRSQQQKSIDLVTL